MRRGVSGPSRVSMTAAWSAGSMMFFSPDSGGSMCHRSIAPESRSIIQSWFIPLVILSLLDNDQIQTLQSKHEKWFEGAVRHTHGFCWAVLETAWVWGRPFSSHPKQKPQQRGKIWLGQPAGALLTVRDQHELARQAYEPLAVGTGFRVPAKGPAGVRVSLAVLDGGKSESVGAVRGAFAREHRALIGLVSSRLRLRAY